MSWQHVLPAILICACTTGPAFAAARHDSDIEALCLAQSDARRETAIVETRLATVPALVRIPAKVLQPPILLWHGFGPPASERALMEALPLDDVPAIKVYLGLPQFGAREAPGGREDMVRRQNEDLGRLVFEPIVVGAAQELPSVIAALQELKCVRAQDKVGLFGFSAGGAAALLALAEGKAPIGIAVVVNASTGLTASVQAYERATNGNYMWSDYTRELARRTDAVQRAADIARNRPALLILHGANDAMLPAQNVIALRDALAPFYRTAGSEQRLQVTLVDGLSHGWADSAHADEVRRAIADWFNGLSG
ncbi:MAG TPA: prolyl oligopeptidase family serine peptidase [Steroidobacteraceae bacterium]|jgi:dienelactone hydrolase|nr:prolyl oligopeptidase family serine peptidase [Steroidobacteraceae bacterium]